jgi:hypothetical protein
MVRGVRRFLPDSGRLRPFAVQGSAPEVICSDLPAVATTGGTAIKAAAVKSTAAQNGGHQRVLATNPVRCCHRSFRPWPASPATSSQPDPVTPTAATTTKTDATLVSTAITVLRPSATLNPM